MRTADPPTGSYCHRSVVSVHHPVTAKLYSQRPTDDAKSSLFVVENGGVKARLLSEGRLALGPALFGQIVIAWTRVLARGDAAIHGSYGAVESRGPGVAMPIAAGPNEMLSGSSGKTEQFLV